MDGDGKMTDFEKNYLKAAICNMIDEDRTYGHIDTMVLKENPQHRGLSYYDFIHRTWEFKLNKIGTNEHDGF